MARGELLLCFRKNRSLRLAFFFFLGSFLVGCGEVCE